MTKMRRLVSIMLTVLFAVMLASAGLAYADNEEGESESKAPLREVHKVAVDDKTYCFFVEHNVVLTPAEISEKTDEELTAWILDCAGLYMKEANCKVESHKAVTAQDWTKKGGRFLLSADDIASLRGAAPEDGKPEKLYMDLKISTKPAPAAAANNESQEGQDAQDQGEQGDQEEEGDQQEPEEQDDVYSTFKRVSPRLLFVAVATEADAAQSEDICEAPARKPEKQQKIRTPKMPKNSEAGETLPEYRTIRMADRSGAPVEETLKDGDPVTLEWIEPDKHADKASLLDRIPGGAAGLTVIGAAAAGLIAAAVMIGKRRREEED